MANKKVYTQEEINKMDDAKVQELFDAGKINDDMWMRFFDNKREEEQIVKDAIHEFSEMNLPKLATEYSTESVKELTKLAKEIKTELGKIETSFTKVAFNLYKINEDRLFIPAGYKNITDMAKKEFNIAKQTCYNFINVVERFGEKLPDGKIGNKISPDFKDFKSSQLIAMLGMTEDDLKEINAEMSVRDIKKLSKDEPEKESDVSVSESDEPIDVDSKTVNRQVIIELSNMQEYDAREDFIYQQIKNALKDSKHKVEIAYTW